MYRKLEYFLNFLIKEKIESYRVTELLKQLNIKEKFELLDIGSGEGVFLEKLISKGFNVMGIDVKKPHLKPFIKSSSLEKFRSRKKFDVITLYHVIEHLKNPILGLKKIKNLLKDDGIIVIETPLLENFTHKILKEKYFAYHDKSHISLLTKKSLNKILRKQGLFIVKKGFTLYEFPFAVIREATKNSFPSNIILFLLFIPLKILSFLGFNDEIVRYYCKKTN